MPQGIQYRVFLSPRENASQFASEIEITDWVELSGLREVVRSIDSTDYDIGAYTFNDVTLKCDNSEGLFSEPSDSRSYFTFSRDLAKVRIVYFKDDVQTTTFRGLINDDGTRNDLENDSITFRVLGPDSVLRRTTIITGRVADGTSIKNAIFAVLNREEISFILGISLSNINPDLDGTVDVGSELDGEPTRAILNQLLFVSNSVMVLDASNNVIVKSRDENTSKTPLALYGRGDLAARENIVSLKNFNSGQHRIFNTIEINERTAEDATSRIVYGARKKSLTIDWLTDTSNIDDLAERSVAEWKTPKTELEVTISTDLAKGYDLLDRVTIDYPLIRHPTGRFLPVCGVFKAGDADAPLPRISGSLSIEPNIGFKIIEIRESASEFLTTFKLRRVGTTESDGFI